MKIPKDGITNLTSRGYVGTQIPTVCIGCSCKEEDVPDSWVFYKNFKWGFTVGKQSGYLHLSPEGFVANYNDLEKTWVNATSKNLNRDTWTDFVIYAFKSYDNIIKRAEKGLKKTTPPMHVQELKSKLTIFEKQLKTAKKEIIKKGFKV